jgi:TolB-like protein
MRFRNLISIALMMTLLGYWALQESIVWGGSVTEAPASIKNMAYPLPNNPSFAVLPFNDMSGDTEPKYLNEGFANTLFDALSDISSVFVIDPMSTAKYAGKPFNVKKVAEDLGVHYVVTGSLQKSGDQLKIGVQMIDALKGTPVWSKTYEAC